MLGEIATRERESAAFRCQKDPAEREREREGTKKEKKTEKKNFKYNPEDKMAALV